MIDKGWAWVFEAQDQKRFSIFHLRTMFTTGMGVLGDGYGLSSISIVLPLVLASFGMKSLTGIESSLLTGSALFGMAVGAIIFGLIGNKGRKRFYGVDVLIMSVAAIAQAFVPDVTWLIIVRLIFGIGAGADYVLSPTIMGEHANAQDRGKIMAAGFGISWVVGAILAGAVDFACKGLGLSPSDTWRIVLAMGAVPTATVIYLRRRLPETARFLARIKGDKEATQQVLQEIAGDVAVAHDLEGVTLKDTHTFGHYFARHWKPIVSASLLWFLGDIVGYSSGLYGPTLIAKGLGFSPEGFTILMYGAFSLPALGVVLLVIDKWGRKRLQALGAVLSACALVGFGILKDSSVVMATLPAFMLFATYTFTAQMGPGAVAQNGISGVEIAPTKVRTLVQAITVASGRLGATISAFIFPLLFKVYGEAFAIYFLAAGSLLIAIVTLIGLPETRKKTLESSSSEDLSPSLAENIG